MCVSSQVRAVIGHTYMLTQDEELWQKQLPAKVEALMASPIDPLANRSDRSTGESSPPRDKTRVVSYRVPHNAAVQVYDYREKKARWDGLLMGGGQGGVGSGGEGEYTS